MNRYEYEALALGYGLTAMVGLALWLERPEVPALTRTAEYLLWICAHLAWVKSNLGIEELAIGSRFYQGE